MLHIFIEPDHPDLQTIAFPKIPVLSPPKRAIFQAYRFPTRQMAILVLQLQLRILELSYGILALGFYLDLTKLFHRNHLLMPNYLLILGGNILGFINIQIKIRAIGTKEPQSSQTLLQNARTSRGNQYFLS